MAAIPLQKQQAEEKNFKSYGRKNNFGDLLQRSIIEKALFKIILRKNETHYSVQDDSNQNEVLTQHQGKYMKIAFAGERGAYDEAAAAALFDFDIATFPFHSYGAIFDALDKEEVALGILPIENNYTGIVFEVIDLLRERDVAITHEIEISTTYVLAAVKGSTEEGIRRIYGHPIAFSQCEDYLRSKNQMSLIPRYDIAQSNMEMAQRALKEDATLCSRFAASMYGLSILKDNCNTLRDSKTRYVALAKQPRLPDPEEGEPQTMVMFEMRHEPGALMRCLEAFSNAKINMLNIFTRPTRGRNWEYTTFVTFSGGYNNPNVQSAVKTLEKSTTFVRNLGSFCVKKA